MDEDAQYLPNITPPAQPGFFQDADPEQEFQPFFPLHNRPWEKALDFVPPFFSDTAATDSAPQAKSVPMAPGNEALFPSGTSLLSRRSNPPAENPQPLPVTGGNLRPWEKALDFVPPFWPDTATATGARQKTDAPSLVPEAPADTRSEFSGSPLPHTPLRADSGSGAAAPFDSKTPGRGSLAQPALRGIFQPAPSGNKIESPVRLPLPTLSPDELDRYRPASNQHATAKDSAQMEAFYRQRDDFYAYPEIISRIDSLVQGDAGQRDREYGTTFYRTFPDYDSSVNYKNSTGVRVNNITAGPDSSRDGAFRRHSWDAEFKAKNDQTTREFERPLGYIHTHPSDKSAPSPSDMEPALDFRNIPHAERQAPEMQFLTKTREHLYVVTVEDFKRLNELPDKILERLSGEYEGLLRQGYSNPDAFLQTYGADPRVRGIWGLFRTPVELGYGSNRYQRAVVGKWGQGYWETIEKE